MSGEAEAKDLYTLVGRYEEFSKTVLARLDQIDGRLETGNETFTEIQERCVGHGNRMESLEAEVEEMKDTQLSLKTKLAIAVPFIDVVFKYGSELWTGILKVMNGG